MTLLDIARLFRFVREATSNRGQRVEAIQTWSGGEDARGTSWCAWYVTMVFDLYYQGRSLLPRMGSTEAIRQLAVQQGWVVTHPLPEDLVISINAAGVAHHIGIVTQVSPLTSIAGNTSDDGTSSNGDRVAEHMIRPPQKIFARIPPPPSTGV